MANHSCPLVILSVTNDLSFSYGLNMPELFYSDGSPYARICRMAIRERGLAQDIKETITTLRDPQAVVLPYNPTGKVPALALDDGYTLCETTVILQWLDTQGSAPPMLPQDTKGLAAYGRVLSLLDGIAVWNRELRRPESERSPSVLALEAVRADRTADVLSQDVAGGAYQTLDAASLALLAVLGYAQKRHTVWQWQQGRSELENWFNTFSQRPSFMDTIPQVSG